MKKVWVAGVYQGKEENKLYIEAWCRKLTKLFPDILFINGVSSLSFYYDLCDDSNVYLDMHFSLDRCVELMKTCDAIVTVSDYSNSIGTWIELFVAKEHKMHIYEHIDDYITKLENRDGDLSLGLFEEDVFFGF
jgi:hypothetical protein